MLEKFAAWDKDLFIYLNSLGVEQYDTFWSTVTQFTTWIPLFLLFIFLFFFKNTKREGAFMFLTLLVMVFFVVAVTALTKETVMRLRPNNDLELNAVIRILKIPSGYSFFSGHSSSSFSITTLVVLFFKKRFKWVYLFYVWPLLFAISRIYVGVHFPLDVAVGALVGMFAAWLFYKLHQLLILPYLGLSHHE